MPCALFYFSKSCKVVLDKENLLDCNMYNKLYDVLKCQGKWLNNNENYFWNCNHGIYEDRALICLAKLWETDEAKKWLKNAKIRLLSQKKFAFTDEMVHVENSPEYHLVVLDLFMRIAVFLKQFDDSYGEELYQAIKVSEEFLNEVLNLNIPSISLKITSIKGFQSRRKLPKPSC